MSRKQNQLITAAERAHRDALIASRRAIRAGDLAKAERWMKLAERHARASTWTYRQHDLRVAERILQHETVRRHANLAAREAASRVCNAT